jgi:phenylacetate-coenzyme A ligase PaaK-like adenylate-forming protein
MMDSFRDALTKKVFTGLPHIIVLIFAMRRAKHAMPIEIERIREKRLRRLLRTAVAQSPFYRNLYRGINIETCRLSDLPVVDKKTMMENFDDVVTDRSLKKEQIVRWIEDRNNFGRMYLGKYVPIRTSGTTGEMAVVVYDRWALDYVNAAVVSRDAYPKRTIGETVSLMLGALLRKHFIIASILMTGGASCVIAACPPPLYNLFVKQETHSLFESIPGLVEKLNAAPCNQLYSYPTILDKLAREQLAGRLKLKLEEPMPGIISLSEPLTENTKRLIRKAWGLNVQDHYGAAECIVMARSCDKFDRMHVMSDLCCLEIVDSRGTPVPDGQTGNKVLMTNLYNHVQPFIRYEISDVTGYSTQSCACGQPFPTLLPVEGRTDDIFYIDSPQGGYEDIHPFQFLTPIVELTGVREYQLVQTKRNEFTFYYVPAGDGTEIDDDVRKGMEEGMRKIGLAGRIKLDFSRVGNIARDCRSGKVRQLMSLVGAPDDLNSNPPVRQ